MKISLKDKFKGTLYGVAIGDALGNPLEGMTPERIADKFGEVIDYQDGFEPKGTYTDDTEMTLCLADSLIEKEKVDLKDISKRFISWLKNARSFGLGCQAAVINLIEGRSPKGSGVDSYGNGAAMRVSPIGLLYSDGALFRYTSDVARITHTNPSAVAGALAVSKAIDYLLKTEKIDPEQFLDLITKEVKPVDKKMSNKLVLVKNNLETKIEEAREKIGTSSIALESVPFAFYCFLKTPYDFENAVVIAANSGGDTDSNASIAGALSGCLNGFNKIPKRFIDGLIEKEKIEKAANGLYNLRRKSK